MAHVATAPGAPTTGAAPQLASLYVGDLTSEVTEAMLYEIFNAVGPIASIRVCRNNVTRHSLGYAYVNFHAVADAERALDTLNYSSIRGRACRIMWSHRDPNLRKTGSANVFVKNLDKNVDNKALYDTFSLFGNILSCKVSTNDKGKSNGYGFVHFETAESAKTAVERVNGMQIGEKSVYVGEFVSRQDREKPEVTNFLNLYVKNFPKEWDEEKVKSVFGEFGKITSVAVLDDKKGRKFAFVNMETAEEANKAVNALHCKEDYRTEEEKDRTKDLTPVPEEYYKFYVQRAQLKSERSRDLKDKFKTTNAPDGASHSGVNLYVKNLDDDMTDEALNELFAEFGTITSAKVMIDDKGRSKGFGFVSYKASDEATKAVTSMHLKVYKGKPLYVGLAEKKEERNARLASRFKAGGLGGPGVQTGFGKGFPGQNPFAGGKGGKGNPMMQQPAMGGPGMYQAMGGQMYPGMMQPGPGGKGPVSMGYPGMMGGPRPMYPGGMVPGMGPQMMGKGQMPPMGHPMMGKGGFPGGMPGGPRPPMNLAPGSGKGGPMARPASQQPMPQRSDEALTANALASAPPSIQKQMLGEKLFPRISRFQPELAGKITGMMLEMDNSELLMLLESDMQLKTKVDEAMKVLDINMKK